MSTSTWCPLRVVRWILRSTRRKIVRSCLTFVAKTCKEYQPPAGRVLVVAPHPDDEVFGAGGTIAAAVLRGCCVTVAFLSRGEASHDGCCRLEPDRVGAERKSLAEASGKLLGLESDRLRWLDLPDGGIPGKGDEGFSEAVRKLIRILQTEKPDTVLLPHPRDAWPDHMAAAEIGLEAVRASGFACDVVHYVVWAWYDLTLRGLLHIDRRAARRVDITEIGDRKRAAIRCYFDGIAPGCNKPWCGQPPRGFLGCFLRDYELLFLGPSFVRRTNEIAGST